MKADFNITFSKKHEAVAYAQRMLAHAVYETVDYDGNVLYWVVSKPKPGYASIVWQSR